MPAATVVQQTSQGQTTTQVCGGMQQAAAQSKLPPQGPRSGQEPINAMTVAPCPTPFGMRPAQSQLPLMPPT